MKKTPRATLLPWLLILAAGVTVLLLTGLASPSIARGQTGTATPTAPPVRPTATGPASPLPTPPAPAVPTPVRKAYPTPRPGADGRVRADGEVLARAVGDRRSATVYGIAESGALYRSDNNGIYWEWVSDSPTVDDFILSPDDPAVLYSSLPLVCNESEPAPPLWVSNDSGWSWDVVEDEPALEPLWADGENASHALAAACSGLYETTDGGVSWQPLSTRTQSRLWETGIAAEIESAGETLYVLVQADDGSSRVAVSADGGVTWRLISPINLDPPFAATALAVDPETPGRLWAVGPDGVWVTEDQGQFWGQTAMGLDDALGGGLHDIVFHPRNLLFAASDAGFYSKQAAEREWEKLGTETVALRIDSLLLLESAPRRLWLNTEIGVYRFLVQ